MDQKSGRSFGVATDGLHNAHPVVSKFEKLWEEIVFAGKASFARFHSTGGFYGDHTTTRA